VNKTGGTAMKNLTLIILAAALAATAANADDYYFCFTYDYPPELMFAKIPGPGSHDGIEIVHSIPIPVNSDALTYDGENWWIYNDDSNSIYCFDQNGDFVSEFPTPGTGYVSGLAWDGDYLWLEQDKVYQVDKNGSPGPFGSFNGADDALAVVGPSQDKLAQGGEDYGSLCSVFIMVRDFYGNGLFPGGMVMGYSHCGFDGLAYHDGIVWACGWYNDSDYIYYHDIIGYYYDEDGYWDVYATIYGAMNYDLSVCNADFINIASSSLGKIKAYFADK